MNPDLLHAQPFLLCWAAVRAGETMDLAMVRWADTSSGKLQGHWGMFHPTFFPHTTFADLVLALSPPKTQGSILEPWSSLHSLRASRAMGGIEHAWHGLPASTLTLQITGPYVVFKSALTWVNITKIWASNIWQGEGSHPTFPPSLPAQVQQGQCWQALAEGGSIPKKQQENLKSQQTRRLQPAEGLSDTQLQVKAASLPDSLSLIKRLVITHLPVKVYTYTRLFGYFIHKTLNKMPFFFVPTF